MIFPAIEFLNAQRVIDCCVDIAHSNGIYGDPGQQANRIGTQGQEWQIIGLVSQVPYSLIRLDSSSIRQLMRNMVLSHFFETNDHNEHVDVNEHVETIGRKPKMPKPKKRKGWDALSEEVRQ